MFGIFQLNSIEIILELEFYGKNNMGILTWKEKISSTPRNTEKKEQGQEIIVHVQGRYVQKSLTRSFDTQRNSIGNRFGMVCLDEEAYMTDNMFGFHSRTGETF